MTRTILGVSILAVAALLSACDRHTASTSIPTSSSTSSPSSSPAARSVHHRATARTTLDPCQLVTRQEASALAGGSFGAGTKGGVPGGEKSCTYGANTTNVFTVNVAKAPSAAAAKADKAAFLAHLKANLQQLAHEGLTVTELPGFADGATFAKVHVSVGGITINGSAIGVLKGTVFFGFSDIIRGRAAAPSSTAMQSTAKIALTRLP